MSEIPEAVCLMPLLYFQTTRTFDRTRGRFDLGNGIIIRKISGAKIQEIQERRGSKGWPLDLFDIERIGYTLEKKIDPRKPKAFDKTISQFQTVVLAMRLFKQGAIGYKAVFLLVDGRSYITHDFGVIPRHASIVPILKYMEEKSPIFSLLTLSENELAEYASFYKVVSKRVGRKKKWPLPIRYFSRMYESKPYVDVLIDCMISFEALVLKGEKEQREKKTPLALAISMLIGKNSKEREKIKATLKEAYNIRNDVVHGKHPRKSELEIATLCWETEDYLRRSIRRLLIEE